MIVKYCELSKKYSLAITDASQTDKAFSSEVLKNCQIKQDLRYKRIIFEIKEELSKFGYEENDIADILVKFLYAVRNSKHKMILWLCYGDYLLENLQKRLKLQNKDVQCIDCGEWFEVNIKDNKRCRCDACNAEYKRIQTRLRVQKYRNK